MTRDSEAIASLYSEMLGTVPPIVGIRARLYDDLGSSTGSAIENARADVLTSDALEPWVVQLMQFAIFSSTGFDTGASIHARAALHAGATTRQLVAVSEIAWLAAGMPAYNLAVRTIHDCLVATTDADV